MASASTGLTDDQIRTLIAWMQQQAEVQAGPGEDEEPLEGAPHVVPQEDGRFAPSAVTDAGEYQAYGSAPRRSRQGSMADPGSRALAAVLAMLERLRSQADPTLPEQDNEEYLRRMLDVYIRQAGLSRALTAQRLTGGGEAGE